MTEPGWVMDVFAVAMVAVSAYCVLRLVAVRRVGRRLDYDVNLAHASDGIAMAGMLSPGVRVLPAGAWEAVFAALALWFAVRSVRFASAHGLRGRTDDRLHGISHYLTHLVMSCSMLYMFLDAAPVRAAAPGEMAMGPAPGTAGFLVLPLVFVVVLAASAVWHVDALGRFSRGVVVPATAGAGAPSGVPVAPPAWLAPRLEMGCHIVICVTMVFMLILMF